MPAERPVFVVGCPRSGTTMLQLMLHSHPRIAVPPETRFLLTAYWQRRHFGDLSRVENRRRLARWIVDRPASRFEDLGLDYIDKRNDLIEAVTADDIRRAASRFLSSTRLLTLLVGEPVAAPAKAAKH